MPRILRIVGSVATVVVAYWAYRVTAVPWIEPPAGARRDDPSLVVGEPIDRLAPYRGLFQPGDWELEEGTKILDVDRVKLLWNKLTDSGDGSMRLYPCTIIFAPHGDSAVVAERASEAVVLQAPQGAELTFDEPLDLRRGSVGRLVDGRLLGPIVIRGEGSSPGPEDDLLITTRDLLLTEERIQSDSRVDFALGPNAGRGSGVQIHFRPGDVTASGRKHGLNVDGVDRIEVQHLEQLRLLVSRESLGADLPGAGRSAAQGPSRAGGPDTRRREPGSPPLADAVVPIEISCKGPFRFELGSLVASFHEEVDLRVLHPQGPSDQISAAELLAVHFARRPGRAPSPDPAAAPAGSDPPKPAPPKDRSPLAGLQPTRIEAKGHPVVVFAPSKQVEARGTRLVYDLVGKDVVLEDDREALVRWGPPEAVNELHAPRLGYRHAGPGRLGQAEATGPGWLRRFLPDRPGQPFEAQWGGRLALAPSEEQQLASLTGGAQVRYATLGKLVAPEIYVWFFDLPDPANPDRPRVIPDRLMAGRRDGPSRREVSWESARFSGAVDRLEAWFKHQVADGEPLPQTPPSQRPGAGTIDLAGHAVATKPKALPAAGAPAGASLPGRHFQVEGDLLRAEIVLAGQDAQVAKLTMDRSVKLVETRTDQPGDRPLVVTGDWLQVVHASQPYAAVTVAGSPGHFEGRGLGLTGPSINLNRGTQRLWIEGPGRMDFLVPRELKLQGQSIAPGTTLVTEWKGGMTLVDQRTLRFAGSVVASVGLSQVRAEVVDVTFQEPLRFDDLTAQQPSPERIVCRGNVGMENRRLDRQVQVSLERMEVPDLSIDLGTGKLGGSGPGRLTVVSRREASELIAGRPGPGAAAGDSDPLTYLEIRFQREMSGSFVDRALTFKEGVRAVYGPVPAWDATLSMDHPEALGPRGGVLGCETLSVVQMLAGTESNRPFALEAVGNATVESQSFLAKAVRITYDQSKGLMVLEGNGWIDATLYMQDRVGAWPQQRRARKIQFWPESKKYAESGAHLLDLSG